MKNKHVNLVILSAFLLFFIFMGALFYNINNSNKDKMSQNIINTNSDSGLIASSNDLNIKVPELNMPQDEVLKVRLKKEFIHFIDMIYENKLDTAYEMLNKEYVKDYSVYEEEFKTLFNKIRKNKYFKIVEDSILEDRYIIRVYFFDNLDNGSGYTDETFTIFIEDGCITYADRGISSSEQLDISVKNEDMEVSINKVIHDTKGLFYEMGFLNKTNEQIKIENIYGIKNGNSLKHEMFKGNFLSYELKPMFYKKNLVLFKELDGLDSIKIEFTSGQVLNVDL